MIIYYNTNFLNSQFWNPGALIDENIGTWYTEIFVKLDIPNSGDRSNKKQLFFPVSSTILG